MLALHARNDDEEEVLGGQARPASRRQRKVIHAALRALASTIRTVAKAKPKPKPKKRAA